MATAGFADAFRAQVVTSTLSFGEASTTATTWTAMPAATTEFPGTNVRRKMFDASGCTRVRLITRPSTVGAAGATLGCQYSLNGGTTWFFVNGAADGDLGSVSPQVAIDTAGVLTSPWATLAAAARTDALWRVVGDNGNGVIAPVFPYVNLQFQ